MGDWMKKILVVDDMPASRRLLVAFLGESYAVLEAADGQQCLDMARSQQPDIVLLDLSLPKIDGIEVIRRMRSDDDLAAIPVFALTAHSLQEYEKRALEAGCDEYFVKPFSLDALKDRVDRLFEEPPSTGDAKGDSP
jgi:two-component system cell cycle response regulator